MHSLGSIISSFIFITSGFLLACYMGRIRILNSCCDFSHFGGSTINVEGGGDVNMRCLCERYQPQLKVLGSSEVVGYKPGLQCL